MFWTVSTSILNFFTWKSFTILITYLVVVLVFLWKARRRTHTGNDDKHCPVYNIHINIHTIPSVSLLQKSCTIDLHYALSLKISRLALFFYRLCWNSVVRGDASQNR